MLVYPGCVGRTGIPRGVYTRVYIAGIPSIPTGVHSGDTLHTHGCTIGTYRSYPRGVLWAHTSHTHGVYKVYPAIPTGVQGVPCHTHGCTRRDTCIYHRVYQEGIPAYTTGCTMGTMLPTHGCTMGTMLPTHGEAYTQLYTI